MTEHVPAAAEGLPAINRRTFLRQGAAVGITAAGIGVPAVVAEAAPARTTLETVMWHLREIERLTIEDGATRYCVIVVGNDYPDRLGARCLQLTEDGSIPGPTKGMFQPKGGDA